MNELKDFPQAATGSVETPCHIVNTRLLENNLRTLDSVQRRTGAEILLALKGFAMFSTFPLIRKYLHGVCASGPYEARLGREEFGREVHTFAPAFSDADMDEVIKYSDHVVFNSVGQWHKHRAKIERARAKGKKIQVGLRVNPGHSEVKVALYNPSAPGSRLGIQPGGLDGVDLDGVDGLHFHALCEQGADVLVRVLAAFEKNFGKFLPGMKWANFGGGHHITRPGYDVDLLCRTITNFRQRHGGMPVYLEPGEAVALNTGVLVASVLDITKNGKVTNAILDTSAEAHMPDVLAMPYRPCVVGAGKPGEKKFTYRLGGVTCLAGDVIGDYSFDKPLKEGDRLVFTDMAHYSMVKSTTFNGIPLPSIATYDPAKGKGKAGVRVVKKFGYSDYRDRLS